MKILTINQIREADTFTVQHEPISSIDLMERAARGCAEWILKHFDKKKKIIIFCGLGNNGGDGLAIARLLSKNKFNVEVCVIKHSERISDDFKINFERLTHLKKIKIFEFNDAKNFHKLKSYDIYIDALIGSGLTKQLDGLLAETVSFINKQKAIKISIDIPSGLFGDNPNSLDSIVVSADYTFTFQTPKYSFLFPENEKFCGDWQIIPIGIHHDYLESVQTNNYLITKEFISTFLKKRKKFAHKGNFGHALLISGSYGKMGAALLAAKACLRSGIGLITVHIPKSGYEILQTGVPEAMTSIDKNEKIFSDKINLTGYNAIAIGPGIGQDVKTQAALKDLILHFKSTIIFDADAINIIGLDKSIVSHIPPFSIFTPHVKEFERLTGKAKNDFHRNNLQRSFAKEHKAFVILKGANTSIACPDGTCYFNTTGNPGMATAGSGDVLTGILLGLLGQGYSPKETCILGVFLHGLSGDISAKNKSFESLIAGDIIENLGKAFSRITKKN